MHPNEKIANTSLDVTLQAGTKNLKINALYMNSGPLDYINANIA